MMRSVYLRMLYDRRWFIFGWTLGLAVFAAMMVVFYPTMRPEAGMQELLENMPAALQGMVGDMAALNSFDTYLATQLFDIRGSIIAGIMSIILGVSLATKEEESGELRTTLAQPISRTRLYIEKWLAMVSIIIITTVVGLGAGTYLVVPFVEDATMPLETMTRLLAMTILVLTTFATVAYATGTITGKKSVATFIGTIALASAFLVTTFAVGVDWLRDFEYLSLLHYFPAFEIVTDGIRWSDVSVLGGTTFVLLVISLLVFRHRDVV